MFIDFIRNIKRFGLEYYGLWYGIYAGRVSDVDDENRGRIKVIVPTTGNKSTPLGSWALPIQGSAGNGYGFYHMPQVDDIVWVVFEGGKLENPVWLGGWYGKDELPSQFQDKTNKIIGVVTKSGHEVLIDDDINKLTITHNSDNGKSIISLDDDGTILIKNRTDDLLSITKDDIVINDSRSNKVTLNSSGCKIETNNDSIELKKGSIAINTKSTIDIKSNSTINVTSGIVNLNGKVEPAVLGTKMYSWLSLAYTWMSTHTHVAPAPGLPTTPPVIPPPFPPQTMLSIKTKVG